MATKSNRTDEAWPAVGFVGVKHMRAALAGCSRNHISNLVAEGLLPRPIPIDRVRVGWPVEEARRALDALPGLIAERRVRPMAKEAA